MLCGLPIARGEALMDAFDALAGPDLHSLDPSGGVLVVTTYWRPRSGDPNPEQPGEKLSILSYLPTDADELCPCGSGNSFGACCQPLPYWRPVCPNPGMQGYSLVHPQSARFTTIPAEVVYAFLQDDERLYCVEDTPQRAFWTYWGDPAFDTPPFGTLCFGDLELRSEEHMSELQSREKLVCRLLLEKKKTDRPGNKTATSKIPGRLSRKSPRRVAW